MISSTRALALDIERERVTAGVYDMKKGLLLKTYRENVLVNEDGAVRPEIEFVDAARRLSTRLKTDGHRSFRRVAAGIPFSDLSLRILELPFEDREKAAQVIPYELAGVLHINTEDAVLDALSAGEGRVVAVAVEKPVVKAYIEALSAEGYEPSWVGSAAFGVPNMLSSIYGEGTLLYLCAEYMLVVRGGRPLFLHSARREDQLRLGLAYLDAEGISFDMIISACEGEEKTRLLEGFEIERLALPDGIGAEAAGAHAVFMASSKSPSAAGTVNFRKDDLRYAGDEDRLMVRLKMAGVAAVIVCAFLLGDIFIRYRLYANELINHERSLRASYSQLFPGQDAPAGELYQLEAAIKALSEEEKAIGGGINPLEALLSLSEKGALDGIKLTEAEASGRKVSVKGVAPSAASAEGLREKLLDDPLFSVAKVTDIFPGSEGAAFTLTLTLR